MPGQVNIIIYLSYKSLEKHVLSAPILYFCGKMVIFLIYSFFLITRIRPFSVYEKWNPPEIYGQPDYFGLLFCEQGYILIFKKVDELSKLHITQYLHGTVL